MNHSFEYLFDRGPILFPATVAAFGGLITLLGILAAPAAFGFGAPILAIGLVLLAAGAWVKINRAVNPIVLACPKCGIESRTLNQPFKVYRWSDVNYAVIVCSVCGNDFTLPRSAKLL